MQSSVFGEGNMFAEPQPVLYKLLHDLPIYLDKQRIHRCVGWLSRSTHILVIVSRVGVATSSLDITTITNTTSNRVLRLL